MYFYTPGILSMLKGYIVFIRSVSLFVCLPLSPSILPSVRPSGCDFYNQVLFRSFLITYNSAAIHHKLFIFGMGVPGRVLLHSTCMNPWVMPQGRARGQNLGHPNKVVFCSLFIQTISYYTHGIRSMLKEYIVFVRSASPFVWPSVCLATRPSVCPDVIPSVNPFYDQVLL